MNRLRAEKRRDVLACLLEGNSVRSTERLTNVHRDTILRLLVRVGEGCHHYMDRELRDLECRRIEVDEMFCFIGKKQGRVTAADDPNEVGTFYVYIAYDPDTRLVPCFRLGKRDVPNTNAFIKDLSERLFRRIKLCSDAFIPYQEAVERAFGGEIDYGQIRKEYGSRYKEDRRYSPQKPILIGYRQVFGYITDKEISTSRIERQNLQVRMCVRRLTRLTNGFSRKRRNLQAALSLHFMAHNFIRISGVTRLTPALMAGLTHKLWYVRDLLQFSNSDTTIA